MLQNQRSKELCHKLFKTSCTVVPDSVGVNPGWSEEAVVHEYLSDVHDDVVNHEKHKNQRGLLASRDEIQVVTLTCVGSHSMLLDTCREFFPVSERGGKDQNTVENSFQERHDRVDGKEDRRFKRYWCQ